MVRRIFTDLPRELQECVRCHLALPLLEFYKRPSSPLSYRTTCRKCIYLQTKARLSDQERYAYAKKYREDNPRAMRSYYFKYKYGITMDGYDSLYVDQKGCCAICGKHKDSLIVDHDHDHASGAVRGLLCYQCNTGIGQLQDNVDILTKAIEYIKGYSVVE